MNYQPTEWCTTTSGWTIDLNPSRIWNATCLEITGSQGGIDRNGREARRNGRGRLLGERGNETEEGEGNLEHFEFEGQMW